MAQQVKELARDAKRSTEQVKTLIQQTQAAASAAVAATEQTTQEAERGTRLVHQSGEVIARVVQTAQAMSAATRRQQAASEQLLNTMRSVGEVVRQSALSAGEIAQSASELSSTAGILQHIDDSGEGHGASTLARVPDGASVGVAQGR
ncbi:MAG: hypothetical protein C4289_07340 [Chloroflexota bacterium]